jgi:sugar phosphate permease
LGAGLSNLIAGFIVQAFGYPVGFQTLSAIAVLAFTFFVLCMPETGLHSGVEAMVTH